MIAKIKKRLPGKKVAASPSNIDPTRTGTMRRAFAVKIRRAFNRFKAALMRQVVEEDVFGLKVTGNVFCPTGKGGGIKPTCSPKALSWHKEPGHKGKIAIVPIGSLIGEHDKGFSKAASDRHAAGLAKAIKKSRKVTALSASPLGKGKFKVTDGKHRLQALRELGETHVGIQVSGPVVNVGAWKFASSPEKVKLFQDWLKTQIASTIKGLTEKQLWEAYIKEGYDKGAARAFDDNEKAKKALAEGDKAALDFYAGRRDEFLKSSFGSPVSVEKVKLLAGRAFDELANVTEEMSNNIVRTLVEGLIGGKGPYEIAKEMAAKVGISVGRAETIARTELIRAHAEGQLDALENLGVTEVGAMVEWSTAGDLRVCKKCAYLQGVVLKVSEARGMLPRHPNCRCAWIPANVGEDRTKQKRGKGKIDAAIKAATDKDDDWGPAEDIDKARPSSIFNASMLDRLERFDASLNAFCPTGKGGGIKPTCSPGKFANLGQAKTGFTSILDKINSGKVKSRHIDTYVNKLGRLTGKEIAELLPQLKIYGKHSKSAGLKKVKTALAQQLEMHVKYGLPSVNLRSLSIFNSAALDRLERFEKLREQALSQPEGK